MEIKINGGLRINKKNKIILSVYCSPFARYLLSNKINFVDIKFLKDSIELSNGNFHRICIEREKEGHPLAVMFITKLISKNLKEKLINLRKQKPVTIILKDFISEKELRSYNNRLNCIEPKIGLNIPSSDLIKLGCHISCFRQKNGIWYRFNIRNRILEKIANEKTKISLCRKGNDFFIVKDSEGKELKLYKNPKGHPLTYVQISKEFLNDEETELFKKNRRAISFKAFISYKEFNLDLSQFFFDKYERELALALTKEGLKIGIPEMGKREADILLPDIKSQIEITKIMPVKIKKEKNNAHGEGVHINARLCEGFLRVQRNLTNKFFVVLHQEWKEHGWVRDTCNLVGPAVVPIFTNFNEGWAEKVAKEINSHTLK